MLVTIIIPTLNEEAFILETIQRCPPGIIVLMKWRSSWSMAAARTKPLELIPPDVADNPIPTRTGDTDEPGGGHARGDILVFCHADSLLPEGWRDAVIDNLSKPQVSGGTFQTTIEPANGVLKLRNRLNYPAIGV